VKRWRSDSPSTCAKKRRGLGRGKHRHPFVRGIGDGTLSLERFKFWVQQDYVFLIECARLLALAAARSPDLETMTRFATLLKETVETEMNLHRAYAANTRCSDCGS
jgi:thiaminase (transcriptional activator TenA)